MPTALAKGFADPIFDAQAVFRAVMDALARPGTILSLPADLDPPSPLTPELAAIALALADPEAPLWLDAPLAAASDVAGFLRFHTGAVIVSAPDKAAFALVSDPVGCPPFETFALGTQDYPDRSTSLVLATDTLCSSLPSGEGRVGYRAKRELSSSDSSRMPLARHTPPQPSPEGREIEFVLEGPGILGRACLLVAPLPPGFESQIAQNRAFFPRGVDLIFAGAGRVAALPRTTAILGSA